VAILGSDDNLAPAYVIEVQNNILEVGVTNLITEVSYESADGMADVGKLVVMNPDFKVSDARVFQPGNELAMWMGYGNNLSFVGRVIIDKVHGNFPKGGAMPNIEVTGYTKDHQMMNNAPPEVKAKKGDKKKGKGGRAFPESLMSEAAAARFDDYGFSINVDPTPGPPRDIIQKAGMSDYEFVQGMANVAGFVFWVDGDENGQWNAYFLDPEGDVLPLLQDKKYTFEYNTQLATLLSFEPEQLFTDMFTKLVYELHNPKTGEVEKAEFEAEDKKFDTLVEGDPAEPISGDPADGVNVKLYIGDYSIEVASGKSFKTLAQFEEWAAHWFRRNRENFILARGQIIGTETIKARQTHGIAGVGTFYSGDYYFTRVKHIMSSTNGYLTDFNCRKILS
jgi:phage protein D